jgi:hypothetical protein
MNLRLSPPHGQQPLSDNHARYEASNELTSAYEQLARWYYRFLPSGDTKEQQKIMDRIAERFKSLGGMTPALEKKIGF